MNEQREDMFYVDAVLRGDREAFRVLVDRYHNMVYGTAYNMTRSAETAQDVVQEVFYRAFKKMDRYNSTYPFGVWIRRIAVNYILDLRKKKKVDTVSMTTDEETEWDFEDTRSNPRDEKFKQDQEKIVMDAIEQLPGKYKMILLLRHIEQLSYEEIADALAIPLGTVMTQLHRARHQLAEILRPVEQELQA